jgi:UDP-N-acetylmuramyl tripeptide synthase
MHRVDSRRLRGPNLQTSEPAAVAEVLLEEGETPRAAAAAWKREATRMCRALGWKGGPKNLVVRPFPGGLALALVAPVDLLFEATEVNEWAIASASDLLAGRRARSFVRARRELAARVASHANPRLALLRQAALRHDVPFLWDDDKVTLGMAARSATFDALRLPEPRVVKWSAFGRIPVALVTGTNGKTTTARLVARMAKLAGEVPGCTSTDGIAIDERLVEEGDFTGAEGARLVLRNPEVTLAVLETARGGILRRGLAVDACDAALVTNVTSDHLGEFGVLDLPTMARAKAVVGTVVRPKGRVVLNGDDPLLVSLADGFTAKPLLFFASDESPVLASRLAKGHTAYAVRRGHFVRLGRGKETRLAKVAEAPLTFGGAAPHNVANCLAAAALAWSLGLSDRSVSAALLSFGRTPSDNPGRGEVVALRGGVRLLLDFGHNAAGLADLFALARSLLAPGARIVSVHTQPGDRTPDDIAALAREIARAAPRAVVFWESEEYLRGKSSGEVARALTHALAGAGYAGGAIETARSETDAIARAASLARPGDVVVVAPHIGRAEVAAWVAARSRGGSRT